MKKGQKKVKKKTTKWWTALFKTKEERIYLQSLLAYCCLVRPCHALCASAPNPKSFYSVDSLTVCSFFLPISLSYPPLADDMQRHGDGHRHTAGDAKQVYVQNLVGHRIGLDFLQQGDGVIFAAILGE
jgi:hypothetical protein